MRNWWPLLLVVAACDTSTPSQEDSNSVTADPGVAASAAAMDECPAHAAGDSCGDDAPAATAFSSATAPGAADPSAGATHFGNAFVLKQSEALTTAATRIGDAEETVQVTGTVVAVCKKKGCWMELQDGETSAKVFTYAGNFFVPVNTVKGRKAVVEGKLKVKTMSQKFAKHLAQDEGVDPGKVQGPQKKIVIEAQSLTLL